MGSNDQSKTSIFITSKSILNEDNTKFPPRIVSMRHPRSGKAALFLLAKENSRIEEIFLFSEKRSWFMDDTVVDEANIYFSTTVDPLFLILPYLIKINQDKKVVPLEDLLVDDTYPEICMILKTSVVQNLHLIADKKGSDDLNAWMYNEQKTMDWLRKKIEKVAQFFNKKTNFIKKGATSENFVKSSRNNSSCIDQELSMKYAYELVSEYLTEELSAKLLSNLGLSVENLKETISEKRKLNQVDEEERQEINKKVKRSMENNNPFKDVKSKCKSVKEKSTKKCETSSQQITNFFKRK